ncbi:MAG: hypothetical protein ABI668_04625 [Sphingorhabdus sp.]
MNESPLSPPPPPPPSCPQALFIPVPSRRNRHDGWTAARQELFLIHLEQLGVVSAAARAVGMSPKSAYALLKRSEECQGAGGDDIPNFAEAWHSAIEIGQEAAFSLALKRTIEGEARPVFYRGRQVGERRVYGNGLLKTALRLYAKRREAVDMDALSTFLNGDGE